MILALAFAVAALIATLAALSTALARARYRLRAVEDQLAEERRTARASLDTTPDEVYLKDREGRYLRVSRAQAAKLGLADPAEAVGRTEPEIRNIARGPGARAFDPEEERVLDTGEGIVNSERFEAADGPDAGGAGAGAGSGAGAGARSGERWVSITKLPLRDSDGAIIGVFGMSHDITVRKRAEQALRESEERWRTLMDNSQEMVMLVDPAGRLAYASPSVERWLGHRPRDLVGRELIAIGHPDDEAQLHDALEHVAAHHPRPLAHRLKHADGSWHSLQSTLVCLRDDPTVDGVLIAARDVTERLSLEQDRERLDLERRVSHRLEAVGQLAAGIAHEINTPLQFVGDSVSFLKEAIDELLRLTGLYRELLYTDGPLTWDERRVEIREAELDADLEYLLERVPAAFGRTIDGISRVRSIVQAMKRFSHPASSEAAPADLCDAIETTLAVCRNEYKYVAEVSVDFGELPLVTCNIGELNQVFLNLIINAAQAIEEKVAGSDARGRIEISARAEADDAVITIRDDGPGIPRELQDRIYEPFFTTKDVGRGSGQGLALARTIVERHGGSLECSSRPPHGTTFTLRLPLEPQPAPV